MRGNIILSLLLVITCYSFVEADLSGFLTAFPNANLTALKLLDPKLLDERYQDKFVNYSAPVSVCASIPVPPDTDNVNNLRPGNIRVIMAMGDSITAAMSAKDTTFLSMKEYRGLSYAIGGDSGVTTMPNILAQYTQQGYPIGTSTGVGKRDMKTNGLNGAVSGAINSDMLGQAQWLVEQLKANTAINFETDWKLLTLWIGSNNLCDVCKDNSGNNVANFENEVTEALEYLYSSVPRVFVNLVSNLDITQLDNIDSGLCDMLHSIACGCVVSDRSAVLEINLQYQQTASVIAQKFASRNNPLFTVVVQPFLIDTTILERSELSKADCFHPSAYSHQVAAVALWNNMISPAAQKKTAWSLTDTPTCATSETLLYTN